MKTDIYKYQIPNLRRLFKYNTVISILIRDKAIAIDIKKMLKRLKCSEILSITLFRIMQASISNKIENKNTIQHLHVGDVFIFCHITLTDTFDFKNSI